MVSGGRKGYQSPYPRASHWKKNRIGVEADKTQGSAAIATTALLERARVRQWVDNDLNLLIDFT